MKKIMLLLPLLLGAVGGMLRFFQRRTVFGPDGLVRPHPLSLLMLLWLAAAALFFLLTACQKQGKQLTFFHSFALPEGQPPFDLVCGGLLFVVSGAMLLVEDTGGGELVPLIAAALSVFSGLTLLLFLRAWRRGTVSGALLLPPVLLALLLLLTTYQRYASYPVTEAYYVEVLSQAGMACAFHQVAAHGFGQGRRRPLLWCVPTAMVLALCALPDAASLPQAGILLAAAASLFAFWRCCGTYEPPEAEEDGAAGDEGTLQQEEA